MLASAASKAHSVPAQNVANCLIGKKKPKTLTFPRRCESHNGPFMVLRGGEMNPGLFLPLIRKGPFLGLLMKGKELQLAHNSPFMQSHTAHRRYNTLTCNPR